MGVTVLHRMRQHPGPVLALAFIVLQLVDVHSYPLFLYDEVLLNDAAWQFVQTGQFRADVLSENNGFEHRYLWQPPGQSIAVALSYALFGLGMVQTRLPGIVFGGLGVWALYEVALEVSGRRSSALVAAALLFVWPPWILTAKMSRMDTGAITAMLIATVGLIASLKNRDLRASRLFGWGVVGGIGGLFHTVALPWCFALACVLFVFTRFRSLPAAAFSIGVAVPVLLWVGYGLLSPAAFEHQFLALLFNRTGSGAGLLQRVSDEGERYLSECARIPTTLPVLAIAAYGYVRGQLWKEQAVAALLAVTAIVVVLHTLVAGKNSGFYTLYPTTLIFCVVAIGIGKVISSAWSSGRHLTVWFALAFTALLVVNSAAVIFVPRALAWWYQSPQRDYARQMAPLENALKRGSEVWGDPVPWFAIVEAGATLKASNWVPGAKPLAPDPRRHRYVVMPRGKTPPRAESYRKILEFGEDVPPVFGMRLTDKPYTFDLWESTLLN